MHLTPEEVNLARQWFNSVHDVSPSYLEPRDYALAVRLYEAMGLRVPRDVEAGRDSFPRGWGG